MKKILIIITLTILTFPLISLAQANLIQGGTGYSTSSKGDLLVGTTSAIRYSRLPVGTTGYLLMASSTSPVGIVWTATSSLGISGGGSGTLTWVVDNGFLYTATSTDYAKAAYFVATSTTASVFPNSSTTNQTLSGVLYLPGVSDGCLKLASGIATSTGSACNTGTVTSVAMTVPTGLSISGSPITTNGTLALTLQSGYVIPLTASTTEWATAYASTTALTPAYIRGLISGVSPITYNTSTGAIGFDFSTNNTWTGGNIFGNATSSNFFATTSRVLNETVTNSSTTNMTLAGVLYLPGVSNGCLQVSSGIATSTGVNCGVGSGNAAWTIGNGLIYNATSTDLVGIGTTSPTTTLFIQGKGGTNPFVIASSTGSQLLTLLQNGNLGISSTTAAQRLTVGGDVALSGGIYAGNTLGTSGQVLQTTGTGVQWAATTSLGITTPPAGVNGQVQFNDNGVFGADSGLFWENGNGYLGIGTSTPPTRLYVRNKTGANPFAVGTGTVTVFEINEAGAILVGGQAGSSGQILQSNGSGLLPTWVNNTGGSGNSAWTIGNGLIYNATSTDLVGIGTSSPTTTLFLQGKGGTNPFIIASSTGTQLLTFTQAGNLGINDPTPDYRLESVGSNGSGYFGLTNSTDGDIFGVTSGGLVGVASSTPNAKLVVSGGSIITPELTVSTSTTMNITWASTTDAISSNQQLIRLGTSAVTINFKNYMAGQQMRLVVCNPATSTAGTITWDSVVKWPGGIVPGQTTTANSCDLWSFVATNGTSSLIVMGGVISSY